MEVFVEHLGHTQLLSLLTETISRMLAYGARLQSKSGSGTIVGQQFDSVIVSNESKSDVNPVADLVAPTLAPAAESILADHGRQKWRDWAQNILVCCTR